MVIEIHWQEFWNIWGAYYDIRYSVNYVEKQTLNILGNIATI